MVTSIMLSLGLLILGTDTSHVVKTLKQSCGEVLVGRN